MRRLLFLAALLSACGDDDSGGTWQIVHDDLEGALLSVWGSSATDIWAVGGDPTEASTPMVIHFDGTTWERLDPGTQGDLWWVFGFAGGPVYMGGAGGRILRYQDGVFTLMTTPDTGLTVFGIWGASPSDVWAVGGMEGGQVNFA